MRAQVHVGLRGRAARCLRQTRPRGFALGLPPRHANKQPATERKCLAPAPSIPPDLGGSEPAPSWRNVTQLLAHIT